MIKVRFPEIQLSEDINTSEKRRKNATDKGVDHDFTTIILDPDDNIFKTITGKFSDKKDCYEKLTKRGFVVRKSFETKIYDWILNNAKTTFDAYLMLSTAFSKWKGNNVLDDYYVKLLNDIPDLNREHQKGNPNTKGDQTLPNKPQAIDEDIDIPQNVKGGYHYGIKRSDQRKLYRNPDSVNFNDTLDIRVLSPNEAMEISGKSTPEEAYKAIMTDTGLKDTAIQKALQERPVDTLTSVHLEPMVKGIESLEDPKIINALRDRLNNSDETNEGVWVMTSPNREISPVIMTPTDIYTTYRAKMDNPDYVWGMHKDLNRNTQTKKDNAALDQVSGGRYTDLSKDSGYWNSLKTNPKKIQYSAEDIAAAGNLKNFFDTGAYKNTKEYAQFIDNLTAAKEKLEQIYGMPWENFDPNNAEDQATINQLKQKIITNNRNERYDIAKRGADLAAINNAERLDPKGQYNKIKDRMVAVGNPKHQGTDSAFISYLDQRDKLRELIKKQPSAEYFKALKSLEDKAPVKKKEMDSPTVGGNRQQAKKNINDYINAYNHKNESAPVSRMRTMIETFVNRGATQLHALEKNPFEIGKQFVGTIINEETHEQLNDDLFENGKLKPEVKEALLKIANEFEKTLEMPIKPVDVYFTGSNANYNYNDKSDIDVHLVYDFEQLQDQALENFNELIEDYLKAKKNAFNNEYEIKVKGKSVEVGCENLNTPLVSTGVYSLNQDNWIREPKKVNVNDNVDNRTFNAIVKIIDKRLATQDAEAIKRLWDNLRDMRKSSLATDGEFSAGNLIFKKLRNDGYLTRIRDAYKQAKGQELSLESFDEME